MPTYVYETVLRGEAAPVRFEVKQSMLDPALTEHPESGEPVRRVVSGGYGYVKGAGTAVARPSVAGGNCCPGC